MKLFKFFLLFLLLPLFVHSQSNQYFTLQTEVDAANAIFGGTPNDRAYNGTKSAIPETGLEEMFFTKPFRGSNMKVAD